MLFIFHLLKILYRLVGLLRDLINEFVSGESLIDAINLAGGFKSGTILSSDIEVSTLNDSNQSRDLKLVSRNNNDLKEYLLKDGDSINISEFSGLEAKTIELKGEVENPGVYSIMKGDTILDLIDRAGGYTDESFAEGAVFLRNEVANQQRSFL